MAPEAFKGVLNTKSDIFSSGIIFYILFQGKFPFQGDSLEEMERNINNQVITFGGIISNIKDMNGVTYLKRRKI